MDTSQSVAALGASSKPLSYPQQRMSQRLRLALLALATLVGLSIIAVTALLLLVGSSGPSSSSSSSSSSFSSSASGFDGAVLPAIVAHDFTLTDQYGHLISLSDYRSQVVVLAFLYSTCGPTCIVIAQQIRGALDQLPHPVPVLFVSANPAADSPTHISRFLQEVSLTGRVQYLTGPVSQLRPLWDAYHITPASSGRAAFDRFASVLLLDGQGRERVLFGEEQLTPESFAHDIGKLQAG